MPGRHRITCTNKDGPDPDYRIDEIGGSTGAENTNGPWWLTIDQAIAGIHADKWEFYVVEQGREVDVVVREHPRSRRLYLTTLADGFPPNNLLRLPDCPPR